jgi:hypothetical protein
MEWPQSLDFIDLLALVIIEPALKQMRRRAVDVKRGEVHNTVLMDHSSALL